MKIHRAMLLLLTWLLPAAALAGTPTERLLESWGRDARLRIEDPATSLLLHRMYELRARLPDDVKLGQHLAEIGADAGGHALVRAHARYLAARLARVQGDLESEARLLDRIGFIREFQVIGPFDDEGRAGFPRPDGPEREGYAPEAEYQGQQRKVRWHAFPGELVKNGRVDLSDHLVPSQNVCGYLATTVRSEGQGPAALRIGAAGPVAVWYDNVLVHASEAKHPAALDQVALPLRLDDRPVPLLVKVCSGEAGWQVLLRVTWPDGRALAGMSFSSEASALAGMKPVDRGSADVDLPWVASTTEAEARPVELVDLLRARADSSMPTVSDLLDLSFVLQRFGAHDREQELEVRAAETAVALARDRADLLLFAHRFFRDANRARGVLDLAHAASPGNASVLIALAEQARLAARPFDAARLARMALALRPGDLDATVTLARVLDTAGLPAAGLALLHGLDPGQQRTLLAAREILLMAEALNLGERADQAAAAVLARDPTDALARDRWLARLDAAGDLEGHMALLHEHLRRAPADRALRLELATLLDANGRAKQAQAQLDAALALCPEAADVHEVYGHFLRRHGRNDEAQVRFGESLRLRPQNPELAEYVENLAPVDLGFRARYERDAAALARSVSGEALSGEEAIEVLWDLRVTRVHPNGLATRYQQSVFRVLSSRGAEDHRRQVFRFTAGRQRLKVLAARVFRAAGGVDQTTTEYEQSLSDPEHRLYYDVRAKVVELPELQPGDVVEVQHELSDQGDNLFADQFGELVLFQRSVPVREARYVLLTPAGRTIFASSLPQGVQREERLAGEERALILSAKDLEPVRPEPRMPGFVEVANLVHLSTSDSWETLGRWYAGLVKDQFAPDDGIRKVVTELTEGLTDTRAKVEAIHGFVVRKTRYVGLEFGLHSYKPYSAPKVFSRGFGDCKDKATLMSSMLTLAGVDSRLVVLRTRNLGRLPDFPPSLTVLNHAILYVPELDLYLDATAESAGPGELPPADQGVPVLLVSPEGQATRARTPVAQTGDNLTEVVRSVSLASDGSAQITGRTVVRGDRAPRYRTLYESAADRRERFERTVAQGLPGARVRSLEMSDPQNLLVPVALSYEIEVPHYAVARGADLTLVPGGEAPQYAKSLASLSQRRYDLVLPGHFVNRTRETLQLPAGAVVDLPKGGRVSSRFGSASLELQQAEQDIAITIEVRFETRRVKAEDYAEFRSFCTEVDRLLDSRIRIRLEGSS